MSLAGQRTEIASILSTVTGVFGSAYRPTVLSQGAGWPLVSGLERSEETPDLMVRWTVVVILPADEIAAAKWFDANVETIADAFEDWGYVYQVDPTRVATSGGDLAAMLIMIRREA